MTYLSRFWWVFGVERVSLAKIVNDNDLFGYRDFADRLANLVRNIDEPLVIAPVEGCFNLILLPPTSRLCRMA